MEDIDKLEMRLRNLEAQNDELLSENSDLREQLKQAEDSGCEARETLEQIKGQCENTLAKF